MSSVICNIIMALIREERQPWCMGNPVFIIQVDPGSNTGRGRKCTDMDYSVMLKLCTSLLCSASVDITIDTVVGAV